MACCSQIDATITFAGIVRDGCWAVGSNNAAAAAVAVEPPLILADLLLGYRDAIASWPKAICDTVAATKWDRANTAVVQIRASKRVWTAAQHLLREVHAEREIEGRRVTPDRYLRLALADESILSIREFIDRLPSLLDDYVAGAALVRFPPDVKAATAAQALQTLAKAEHFVRAITPALQDLESLRLGHDPQPLEELEGLLERVRDRRSPILERMAEAASELRPEPSQSAPDLFGEAVFTLLHHTEEAIAIGDAALIERVFSKVLTASMVLEDHVLSTYKSPTFLYNPALLDPIVDLLELSGLALVYEALRDDRSADSIRQAWLTYVQSLQQPEAAAKRVLDLLDLADGGFSGAWSPRSIARTEWETRLSERIAEAGYALPDYLPFGDQPTWTAPPLIKMLGVSESMPSIHLPPRAIFAARVIGRLSGESEETLRARPGLKRYYDAQDFHGNSDIPNDDSDNEFEGNEDRLQ